tara:strand:- start:5560 stop:7623 length:2064 start_codon:yes stop_codon:yes gene_type:complete
MIVNKQSPFASLTGIDDVTKFKIDTSNPEIFKILRSKIYSDPIAAICREIMTNCRDAHIEVGTPKVPIEIHVIQPNNSIFNNSTESIVFTDFGPGISPERMEIFGTYTASTKNDNNEESGGFGLGAKTPFAYTDQFTIVTTVDGTTWAYTAFIDETEIGSIVLLDEFETENQNGTSIIIPFKQKHDVHTFVDKCMHYSEFWTVRPKWIGYDATYKESVPVANFCKNRFTVYKGYRCNPMFLIDGIPYPGSGNLKDIKLSAEHFICMNIKVGEFPLQISREQLQYTDEVNKTIHDDIQKLKQRCKELLDKVVSEAKTFKEACLKLKDSDALLSIACSINDKPIWWNEKEVKINKLFKYHDIYSYGFDGLHKINRGNSAASIDIGNNYWYVDTKGISDQKNAQIYEGTNEKFYLIKPKKNRCSFRAVRVRNRLELRPGRGYEQWEKGLAEETRELKEFLEPQIYSSFKTKRKKREKKETKFKSIDVRIVRYWPSKYSNDSWGYSKCFMVENGAIQSDYLISDCLLLSRKSIVCKEYEAEIVRAASVARINGQTLIIVKEKNKEIFESNGYQFFCENKYKKDLVFIGIRRLLDDLCELPIAKFFTKDKGRYERLVIANKLTQKASSITDKHNLNREFNPYVPDYIKESIDTVNAELIEVKRKHPLIDRYLSYSNDKVSEEALADIQKILS